jgi:hypothetical protein
MATSASGCPIDTVQGSSRSNWSKPHNLAAAICSIIAWPEIFAVGTAILSLSVKSAIVLTFGLRVTST